MDSSENRRPKPRKPVPAQQQGTLQDAGAQAWNGEADRVELYRDGDTLKFRAVQFERKDRRNLAT